MGRTWTSLDQAEQPLDTLTSQIAQLGKDLGSREFAKRMLAKELKDRTTDEQEGAARLAEAKILERLNSAVQQLEGHGSEPVSYNLSDVVNRFLPFSDASKQRILAGGIVRSLASKYVSMSVLYEHTVESVCDTAASLLGCARSGGIERDVIEKIDTLAAHVRQLGLHPDERRTRLVQIKEDAESLKRRFGFLAPHSVQQHPPSKSLDRLRATGKDCVTAARRVYISISRNQPDGFAEQIRTLDRAASDFAIEFHQWRSDLESHGTYGDVIVRGLSFPTYHYAALRLANELIFACESDDDPDGGSIIPVSLDRVRERLRRRPFGTRESLDGKRLVNTRSWRELERQLTTEVNRVNHAQTIAGSMPTRMATPSAQVVTTHAPSDASSPPTTHIPHTPVVNTSAKGWDDIKIALIDDDNLRVAAPNYKQRFHFSQLGFADKRTPNRPRETWCLLQVLARFNGELPSKGEHDPIKPSMRNGLKKSVSVLRSVLCAAFGITDDPVPYTRNQGYRTRFRISDEREGEWSP